MDPDPAPTVLELGATKKGMMLAAALFTIGMGLLGVVSAVTGAVHGGVGVRVGAGVFGGFLLLIGIPVLLAFKLLSRSRQLVVEQRGIRYVDPRGKSFAFEWPELATVAISRTKQRVVPGTRLSRPAVMVRLDLTPADAGVRTRRPELEHLWEFHRAKNAYRLPLGDSPELIAPIDEAMRRLQPSRYLGVQDEGFAVGLF